MKTNSQKVEAIREAIQNSRDNGNEPDLESAENLAIDLWMCSECEDIDESERLRIVLFLRGEGSYEM